MLQQQLVRCTQQVQVEVEARGVVPHATSAGTQQVQVESRGVLAEVQQSGVVKPLPTRQMSPGVVKPLPTRQTSPGLGVPPQERARQASPGVAELRGVPPQERTRLLESRARQGVGAPVPMQGVSQQPVAQQG